MEAGQINIPPGYTLPPSNTAAPPPTMPPVNVTAQAPQAAPAPAMAPQMAPDATTVPPMPPTQNVRSDVMQALEQMRKAGRDPFREMFPQMAGGSLTQMGGGT